MKELRPSLKTHRRLFKLIRLHFSSDWYVHLFVESCDCEFVFFEVYSSCSNRPMLVLVAHSGTPFRGLWSLLPQVAAPFTAVKHSFHNTPYYTTLPNYGI